MRYICPMIEIVTKDAQAKLADAMKGLSKPEIDKATARAINFTLARVDTASNREIRKVYNLKQADVRDQTQQRKATPQNVTGLLLANKNTLNISKFDPVFRKGSVTTRFMGSRKNGGFASSKTTRSKGASGVTVEILKGKKETISSAWLSIFGSGKSAVFARGTYGSKGFDFGKERLPIQALKSKSIYWAIQNTKAAPGIVQSAEDVYQDRLIHEITKGLRYAK